MMGKELPARKFYVDRTDLQEGDPFLPPSFRRRRGSYVEAACQEARDLSEGEDCYELRLFRLFRDEYVARRPDSESFMARHQEEAARILRAIECLPANMAHEVYLSIYESGVAPVVSLILDGRWDEAYETHRETHENLKARFLEDSRQAG